MTPQEALQFLSNALEPDVKLSRVDYVRVQAALETLNKLVNPTINEPSGNTSVPN